MEQNSSDRITGADPSDVVDPARVAKAISDVTDSMAHDVVQRTGSGGDPPDVHAVAALNERLRWLAFPGFFGPRQHTPDALQDHVGGLINDLSSRLLHLIDQAFDHDSPVRDGAHARKSGQVVMDFLDQVTEVRRKLLLDEQAAFGGDPAAQHIDEAILCHPGIRALAVHRFAHELHRLGVPLLPRMMSEDAHSATGIDIHPGARIGEAFFIDHGSGVVIGETAVVGDRCTIYQGVTLGAANFERNPDGTIIRGMKRHPTLEDDVTIYAGATILGGETIIGKGSIVNGGVFLTRSVPANSIVQGPRLEIHLRSREAQS